MPIADLTSPDPAANNQDWLNAFSQTTGHSIAALDQMITNGIQEQAKPAPNAAPPDWEIGAYIDTGENQEVNTYAQQEIKDGAEALLFRLYLQPDADDIGQLLRDIKVDNHSLHCTLRYPGQDPAELFRDLIRYLRREGYQLQNIAGSVDFDPLLDWSEPPFPPLIRLLYFVSRWMPRFKVLQVNAAGFNNGTIDADAELALAIAKGAEYMKQIERSGYPAALANNHLQFACTIGSSFYGDVAKLRALRVLWTRVLTGLGIDVTAKTEIAAHTDIAVLEESALDGQTLLRVQTLAAASGGADMLFLAPAEGAFQPATDTGRKLALETQRRVRAGEITLTKKLIHNDYLNGLTDALVSAAWQRYETIEAQGGFAQAVEF